MIGTLLASKIYMRALMLSVVAAGCVSSTPLESKDPWGWPITTWQARHGNVLVIECVLPASLPDGIGMNDYVVSHGKRLPVFVEPPTRSVLIEKHCARTSDPAMAPGAERPSTAMIYTPSVEQLAGLHRHQVTAHAASHGGHAGAHFNGH